MYLSCGLTLSIEYPQILNLIKTLPLYWRQWLGNMTHSQPEKKAGKEKAPQAFFTKELSKTSSLHQPLDIFAA